MRFAWDIRDCGSKFFMSGAPDFLDASLTILLDVDHAAAERIDDLPHGGIGVDVLLLRPGGGAAPSPENS